MLVRSSYKTSGYIFTTLRSDKGIALIFVLWVLTLLTVIVAEFCTTMRTEINITRNVKDYAQACYIARAGINKTIIELVKQDSIPFSNVHPKWRVNVEYSGITFAYGSYDVWIENEGGKINLNTADQFMLGQMLDGFGIESKQKFIIIDSIFDWKDADSLNRANGAENKYYHALEKPYDCKNHDFESVNELRLVRGVTPEIFNNGLEKMVTVYQDPEKIKLSSTLSAKERDEFKRSYHYYLINYNAATNEVLKRVFGVTPENIRKLMEYRKEKDFISAQDFAKVANISIPRTLFVYLTDKFSPYYTIKVVGKVGEKTRARMQAVVKIDREMMNGYKIIKWSDDVQYRSVAQENVNE